MFTRFQTKLIFLFAALFIIVQAITYFSVYFVTKNNLENQASTQLSYSSNVFSQSVNVSTEKWINEVKIYSTDFGFLSAVTTDDQATILSALDNLSKRIGANQAMLVSLDNEIVAEISDGNVHAIENDIFDQLIEIADEEGEAKAFLKIDGKIYQYTIVPILAPIPVAWVGLGVLVDKNSLLEIKKSLPLGVDITIIEQEDDKSIKSLETTLDQHINMQVGQLSQIIASPSQNKIFTLNRAQYMVQAIDLPSSLLDNQIKAVLTYSLDVAYSPYKPLAYALLLLLGIGLLSLIGGSVTVAKSVSRPLQVLTQAAQMIQIGKYEKIVDIKQKDEIGQLADHFNEMVIGIQDREEKIIFQSEHDFDTGLPNQFRMEKYIEKLLEKKRNTDQVFSVLQISIDRFDDVRNTLGYETSRRLVKEIALKLHNLATYSNLVARLSTVNFCVVLENADSVQALKFSKEIRKSFEEPLIVDNFTIDTNIKIGIASYPEHAQSADILIQRANIAAIIANDNIDHTSLYDQDKDSYDADSLSLMGDFRKSLEEGHVQFHYQPKIDLALNRITHVEALVRWTHPERGFIAPDDFITMAEQTGQIHHLTNWGLETAIAQCKIWAQDGIDLKMAINLSARDLSNKKLPDQITSLLEKYNVAHSQLVLEVTENAIMQDPDLALSVLNALDQHGLLLSIDDYGTGYSSMSYLKKLPVKELKIDKSFVLNLSENKEDEILVRSAIDLGHNLGLKVTAEGIEDAKSLQILRDLGCDLVQGYYLSKPLPVEELNEFLATSSYGLVKS